MKLLIELSCIEIQKLLDSKQITKEAWEARYNPIPVERY